MGKYIDADRLKAEINKRKKSLRAGICGEAFTRKQKNEMLVASEALDMFNRIIDSLQQEQESVAERFAKIVRANLSEIGKNAQSQFENLYFEITGDKMYGGYND